MYYRHLLNTTVLVLAGVAAGNAVAQINVTIQIGPPEQLVEPVPVMLPGSTWAPGYWAWHGDRYIWMRGRPMLQRSGYRWVPDSWAQRNGGYFRQPGQWVRVVNDRHAPRAIDDHDRDSRKDKKGHGYDKKHKKHKD